MGKRNIEADRILRAATSPGSKASSPFFIRMKELPQIKDKIISKNQAKKIELLDRSGIFMQMSIQDQK